MFCTFLFGIFSVIYADSWSYPYNATEWGSVSATCVEGTIQSPVDLITHSGIAQTELKVVSDMPTNLVASSNHSLTWSINAESLPILFLKERTYALSKVQCHIGSEHTVEGSRYPGSCQFFYNLGNKYVAMAILINDTSLNENVAFDDLLNNVQLDWGTIISGLDLSYYWSYTGSFTTPDCEENVQWFVLRDVIEVTTAQIDQMKTISGLDSSFRDPMPLNGRAVLDGSEIGNVTVVWFVIVGFCTEEAARQFTPSVEVVLGLSGQELVVIHVFETHGDEEREPYYIDVWDVEYMIHVIDNTKTFVDRFLENVGVNDADNDHVTDAIKKHYNETVGNVPRYFYSVRATITQSTFSADGDGVDIIVIIVVVIVILLCFVVVITFYLRKRKVEKEVAVEITVDEENEGAIQTKM